MTTPVTAADFADFARAAALPPGAQDLWADGWRTSCDSLPATTPDFLTEAFVREWCGRLGMDADVRDAFLTARPFLAGSERVALLAWHCHRLLADAADILALRVREWPMLPRTICPMSDMFYAFVFLAQCPQLARLYTQKGIPESVLRETMGDLELWVREHRRKTGRWGLSEQKWLVQHVAANLFQLGRLQFQFGTYRYEFAAYRNNTSRRVVVLPADDLPVRTDGFIAAADEEAHRRTRHAITGDDIEGTPVLPTGHVAARTIRLSRRKWTPVLGKGDSVLNIHIPAGSPMSHAACGDSFMRAQTFFAKTFPEFHVHAYACTSWLLDPQLADYLPEHSNVVRFQRELYLVPVPGTDDSQTMARVFGGPVADLEAAPQETSMQRAVVAHLRKGGIWRQGASILFPHDLQWGNCVYRSGQRAVAVQ